MEAEIARVPADVMVERFCSERELEEHVKRRKADKGAHSPPSVFTHRIILIIIIKQTAKKPSKPQPPQQHPQPNAQATHPHPPPAQPKHPKPNKSSPTSTYPPTTRSSCAKSPTTTPWRCWRLCLRGTLVFGRYVRFRCRSSRDVRLWSMRRMRGRFRRGRR